MHAAHTHTHTLTHTHTQMHTHTHTHSLAHMHAHTHTIIMQMEMQLPSMYVLCVDCSVTSFSPSCLNKDKIVRLGSCLKSSPQVLTLTNHSIYLSVSFIFSRSFVSRNYTQYARNERYAQFSCSFTCCFTHNCESCRAFSAFIFSR